jgi:hypothetical protein
LSFDCSGKIASHGFGMAIDKFQDSNWRAPVVQLLRPSHGYICREADHSGRYGCAIRCQMTVTLPRLWILGGHHGAQKFISPFALIWVCYFSTIHGG